MSFISLSFFTFFFIVTSLYFLLPYRFRWILLLTASYFFYGSIKPEYTIILLITTAIDYFAAIKIEESAEKKVRNFFLALSLTSNLGTLFVFKYFNLFNHSLGALFSFFNYSYTVPAINLLLPIGLSFYIFQSVGYIVDVYRRVAPAERHFGIFALFVSFFPQLLAGPIERSVNVIPQFLSRHDFDYRRVVDGLILAVWGIFQKMVLADNLGIYLAPVYASPESFHGASVFLASYSYFFQIYFDFAAYSCIGIGAAQILGIRLMFNFDGPFFSKTISEFWQRWHVSFYSWLRTYIFMPLGSNRKGRFRWSFNVLIVFLISGLWHGASWNVVLFFLICGGYIIFVIFIREPKKRLAKFFKSLGWPRAEQVIDMFLIFNLLAIAGILFRAESFADGWTLLKNMWIFNKGGSSIVSLKIYLIAGFIVSCFMLFLVWPGKEVQRNVNNFFHSHGVFRSFLATRPAWFRLGFYVSILLTIFIFGVFRNPQEFIYFRF